MAPKRIEASDATLKLLNGKISSAQSEGIEVLVSGGVIARNGRILLLMRSPKAFFANHWDIPGGKVRPDESFIDGFCREIHEETGLVLTGINKFITTFDFLDGHNRHTRQFNFFISTSADKIRIDHNEHSRFEWFSEMDVQVIEPNASPETFSTIQAAFHAMKMSE